MRFLAVPSAQALSPWRKITSCCIGLSPKSCSHGVARDFHRRCPALHLWGYCVQPRKRWTWYAGWVVAIYIAGAVANYTVLMIAEATSTMKMAFWIVGSAGGATLWTVWAVWWATAGRELLRR
jgi:hypothetical protein